MFAARNMLMAHPSPSGGGAVIYDNVAGVGSTANTGSATPETVNLTAAAGADVLAFVMLFNASGTTPTPSSVTFNGNSLTPVQSVGLATAAPNAFNGLWAYRGAALGTGASDALSITIPGGTWYSFVAVSFDGASGLGTPVTAYGSSTAASTGSVSCGANQAVVGAVATAIGSGTVSLSPSGGTNRFAGAGAGTVDLVVSTALATTTFGAAVSPSAVWGAIGLPVL